MSLVDADKTSPLCGTIEDVKPVGSLSTKMNGLNEDSTGSASESGDNSVKPKENGLVNNTAKNVTISSNHGDGLHRSSPSKNSGSDKDKHLSSNTSKHKEGSSSISSKHGSSSSSSNHRESSSSSKHRDGHISLSISKHKEGSSSHHSSSGSSKHKEGASLSHKDKDRGSSSSKPKNSPSSSSPDKHSSGSSKHKETSSSSKHKDSHSSNNKAKEGSSSKDASISSSTDKHKDKNSSSASTDRHKDKSKDSTHSKDKDKDPTHSKDKDKDFTHSKNKDKDPTHSKDKDKDFIHSKDKDKSKDSTHSKDKDKDPTHSKDKDKDFTHSKNKDKDPTHSKDKDKDFIHSKDKDKSKDSTHSKDKDTDPTHSKDKDKDSTHSKDQDKDSTHSKDKDTDSTHSKDKDKDSTHSKDKDTDSTHSKDKDKDSTHSKDKDKDSTHSKDKDKSKSISSSSSSKHPETHTVSANKEDNKPTSPCQEAVVNEEKMSIISLSKNNETLEHIQEEVKVKKEVIETKSVGHFEMKELRIILKKEIVDSSGNVERRSVSPTKRPVIKSEAESEDDDKPLSTMKRAKEESEYEDSEDEDSDVPLSKRNKAKKLKSSKHVAENNCLKIKTRPVVKKLAVKNKKKVNEETEDEPVRKRKREKRSRQCGNGKWEEQREDNGVKWNFLEHKGPVFAPAYEKLPKGVRFYYDGKPMELTRNTEEVAVFYGRMLDHEYTSRDVFNSNYMKDWRKVMTADEKAKITDLKRCNFQEILDYFKKKTEERKAMSKEEKQKIKKENEEIVKEYGFCVIDNHKEKIGNFRIEPPGLFRGRGDHPKQGMLKKRITAEDVIINCSKNSKIPVPPSGHKWKEVRHDNTVTWLASWTENIQGATKYVMLNAASKLKGEKDWQKYEIARKLHKCVDKIRAQYQEDWKSKEMRIRQRAVALYFIDKLALRAGNEKEEGETADTVGCCSLRVEHIKLHDEKDRKQHVVEFDFLGKDSIRYQNAIPVEKRVYKNLQLFTENKQPEDDLFDRLNTTILNKHLQDLMEGLTAKVFRTFNASKTLSEQLEMLTSANESPAAKMLAYNRANRAVAILCNHQRAVPKTFEKSMENIMKKLDSKKAEIKEVKKEIKGIKADYKQQKSVKTKTLYEKKKKTLSRLEEQFVKLEVQATDKDENKEIALGTSKLNYLDPRISVAWCKKFDVALEKVYNKTQRDKFRWAIDMATEHFKF